MSARENILARIRSQTGKAGATSELELAAVRSHIAQHARGPLPSIAMHDPAQHFIAECARLKTTLAECNDIDDVPRRPDPVTHKRRRTHTATGAEMAGWHW